MDDYQERQPAAAPSGSRSRNQNLGTVAQGSRAYLPLCADVDMGVDGVRSIHIPDVSLEDKYLTSHVYPTLPMEPPTCYSVTNRICNLVTTVPGLCPSPPPAPTPTWMCLLLLKLLPLFTGSVFRVERLPLVISGDDLPMEWALYNKHKAADGQETEQVAQGEGGIAKPSSHVLSSQRGRSGERQHQESKDCSAFPKQRLSSLLLLHACPHFPNLTSRPTQDSSCRAVLWLL